MRKILISGGSSGLGLELAKVYGMNGFQIIIVGRSVEKLESALNTLNSVGVSAVRIYNCDISKNEDVKILLQKLTQDHKQIDRLINCAGVGYFGELSSLENSQIKTMTEVNFLGTVYMTQILKPIISERVINIISTAGLRGKKNESVYCGTKFAVRGFTESLQIEWEQDHVTATAVYMGGMATAFWNESDHITDHSRLRDPAAVARGIYDQEDGRPTIIID